MDFTLAQWLQLAGNLSFTGFLILCVGVLGYALYRLYLSNQTDWTQVQQNTKDIAQLNQNVEDLVTKIDQLIAELHAAHSNAQPFSPPSTKP